MTEASSTTEQSTWATSVVQENIQFSPKSYMHIWKFQVDPLPTALLILISSEDENFDWTENLFSNWSRLSTKIADLNGDKRSFY